jgi:16S rRNA (uracil1498-N3)-methyltransferase
VLFYQPQIASGALWLPEDESKHCIKVLRKTVGELITVVDGNGSFYECMITNPSPSRCEYNVQRTIPETIKSFNIHIAIAPTKNADRMEWFVEKATEVGVDTITLMECDHSERSFLKTDRLTKVAISAMKQSQKATLPVINSFTSFKSVIDQTTKGEKFIAFVDFENPTLLQKTATQSSDYTVLIGPEGDFSRQELQMAEQRGFAKVSLGTSRLRTETAGLIACCLLNSINQ